MCFPSLEGGWSKVNLFTVNKAWMTIYAKIISLSSDRFQYKLGLNRLADNAGEEFNPAPICGPGGLYYCPLQKVNEWLHHGDVLCIVEPGPGAQVVSIEGGIKFKTDVLEIVAMWDLHNPATWRWLRIQGGAPEEGLGRMLTWSATNGSLTVMKLLSSELFKCGDYAGYAYLLFIAVEKNHLDIVKHLCASIENLDAYMNRVLLDAAGEGLVEIAEHLAQLTQDWRLINRAIERARATGKAFPRLLDALEKRAAELM